MIKNMMFFEERQGLERKWTSCTSSNHPKTKENKKKIN
jgi:hypothetical protein